MTCHFPERGRLWYNGRMIGKNVSRGTRREFLKGTLAGIAAAAALPSFARGKFEQLDIVRVHIDAGASAPFSALHISDTHLTAAYPHEAAGKRAHLAARTELFGGRQEEALRDSIAWAKDNCDYLLHTGDLIDRASEANFDLVKKYFGSLDNLFGTSGNHEYSKWDWDAPETPTEAYKDRCRDKVRAAYPYDVTFGARTVNGVNFVSLDDVYGYVTKAQTERFAAEVKKGLPIVLLMHVPFYTDFIWRANVKYWRYGTKFRGGPAPDAGSSCLRQREDPVTRDFIAYLRTEPLLKGILAGHLHFTVQERFSPTAVQYVTGGNYGFVGQEVTFT